MFKSGPLGSIVAGLENRDPSGPGPRELRWSLMRVQCWDCNDEPGAWSAYGDFDMDSLYGDRELTDSMTNLATPLVISSAVIGTPKPKDGDPKNGPEDGREFYMPKEGSRRRKTIVKILQDDGGQILEIWMGQIRGRIGSSVLLINERHLAELLSGMILLLSEQNNDQLSKVLAQLKDSLDFGANALNQLQTALFVFQYSVRSIIYSNTPSGLTFVKALMEQGMRCCDLVRMATDGSSSTSKVSDKQDGDPEMVRWLRNIGVDEASVGRFVQERFSLKDVLQLVDREDLKRLGLKLGYEIRVWTAIQRHRNRKESHNTS
ncbi:uncharacterized protein LOC100898928 [Galendromus occidentalis]|uniref:Uncharacterized protein LOC100898928 n=1 Tax=Galendromus occidentalis TaxID=34638 RepID=A0AAJ7WGZ6_9ACAR|nr:uncharacterized protein LOC100898928 [Galendromus occidentalis]